MPFHRLIGRPIRLSAEILAACPELAAARFRIGGLPIRIGGWLMGGSGIAGIALGDTIWLESPAGARDVGLLLHEIRHVQQFASVRAFPWRYVWQTLRRGYDRNPYEIDARGYAARRLASMTEGAHG